MIPLQETVSGILHRIDQLPGEANRVSCHLFAGNRRTGTSLANLVLSDQLTVLQEHCNWWRSNRDPALPDRIKILALAACASARDELKRGYDAKFWEEIDLKVKMVEEFLEDANGREAQKET